MLAIALAALALIPTVASAAVMTLHWTAPGDDGNVGQAAYYELRYSYFPIDENSFSAAIPVVAGVPRPSMAGRPDSAEVIGLTEGLTYYFALRSRDALGNWSAISNIVVARPITVLDVEGEVLQFSEPRPNPASQVASFTIALPVAGSVRIEVFDMAGRRVKWLANGWRAAGAGAVDWNLTNESGQRVGAGLYLVRAHVLNHDWTRRVVVVR
jgi:flagellar hook capping protein FlgD